MTSGVPMIFLRRLRFLRPFSGGGGGEPNVCLTPAICLQALFVNANPLHSHWNRPRAYTILCDLHPGPELAWYSQSSIFVIHRFPFTLSCTRTSDPKTAGRIGGATLMYRSLHTVGIGMGLQHGQNCTQTRANQNTEPHVSSIHETHEFAKPALQETNQKRCSVCILLPNARRQIKRSRNY